GQRKLGSIGVPIPDVDAKIVDLETGTRDLPAGETGELVVRGPNLMDSYYKRPEETALALRDGWLYTGDVARMDEDGYFYIVDRKKELIIVSGYNVYPREVEEVLYAHPAVLEAAAIGVPDPERGEIVKAFIVLRPGASARTEELRTHCASSLARFKIPAEIEFRSDLPKSIVGKVLRRALADEAATARARLGFAADLAEAAADADLAIEAVVEDVAVKRKVFAELDRLCPPRAILATNSSTFVSSLVADATKRPAQVANLHYFNPAMVMEVVEVVQGPHTSVETASLLVEFAQRVGKRPILMRKEIEGFIANRLLRALG